MSARLILDCVSVELGNRSVLDGFSLAVDRGVVTALVGPNGAGKSTAVRVAAGLLKPVAGNVMLDGRPLDRWQRRDLARTLALVPQFPALPPLYPVRNVVALGRTPYIGLLGGETRHDWDVVDACLAETGITDLAARRAGELSGGERQRVAIARALAQEPSVLLLDEPTSNLDLRFQGSVLGLLRRLARDRDLACLVVLHDLGLAGQFCDTVVLMAEGKLVAAGSPGEVLRGDRLSAVYGTGLRVFAHPETGAPLVVHAGH